MIFKIMPLFRVVHGDTDLPESNDYFFLRIESLAESYEKAGWEILSLSFPSEDLACLFMKRNLSNRPEGQQ